MREGRGGRDKGGALLLLLLLLLMAAADVLLCRHDSRSLDPSVFCPSEKQTSYGFVSRLIARRASERMVLGVYDFERWRWEAEQGKEGEVSI